MTRKLVDMPTSKRLRSASSRCSASSRAARVVDVLARALQVRALGERARDRALDVDGRGSNRRRVDGVERRVPVLALRRVEDEHAQTIFSLLDRRLGDDELLLIRRDFRLRRYEV